MMTKPYTNMLEDEIKEAEKRSSDWNARYQSEPENWATPMAMKSYYDGMKAGLETGKLMVETLEQTAGSVQHGEPNWINTEGVLQSTIRTGEGTIAKMDSGAELTKRDIFRMFVDGELEVGDHFKGKMATRDIVVTSARYNKDAITLKYYDRDLEVTDETVDAMIIPSSASRWELVKGGYAK